MATPQRCTCRIWGDLDLTGPDGSPLLPGGTKERAILATLLVAPGFRRSRRWLQALLWADSDGEKGAASLRQSIARLRRALAPAGGLLTSDRMSVWLNAQQLLVLPREHATETLFEGLDLGEEAFEDWLRNERQSRAAEPAAPAAPRIAGPQDCDAEVRRPLVTLVRGRGPATFGPALERLVGALRIRLLALEAIDLREANGSVSVRGGLVVLVERPAPEAGTVTIIDAAASKPLWSDRIREADEDEAGTGALVDRTIEALVNLSGAGGRSEATALAELRNMGIVFEGLLIPGSRPLDDLKRRVQQAIDASIRSGLFLALRNCVRMLEYGELSVGGSAIRRDLVMDDLRRSLALSPGNPLVQAIAGHTMSLFLNQHEAAAEHARLATAISPDSPFCWSIMSLVHLRAGDIGSAVAPSRRALGLGQTSRYRAFFDGTCGAAAACAGQFEAATRHTEHALLLAPQFRAARKFLFLCYENGRPAEDALGVATEIRRTEPDFGLHLLEASMSVSIPAARRAMAESARRLGLY